MHLKRSKVEKTWPIKRKGTKYVVVPLHSKRKGIPILLILRDILKIARNRKEAKIIMRNKKVLINHKARKDERFPVQMFDVISFPDEDTHYRLEIENKKFRLKKITKEDSIKKITKIIGKRFLKNKKLQLNLEDGQNFITKEKFSVGDSAILNLKKGTIEKIIPLSINSTVEIIKGKHSGERGVVKKIETRRKGKIYIIKLKGREIELSSEFLLALDNEK